MEDVIEKATHATLAAPALENLIQHSLEDGKAFDIVSIDLHGKSDIADTMIIASGTSTKHTSFLAQHLIEALKGENPSAVRSVEGLNDGNWVLVDAGDVIVHIFRPEVRDVYNLEKMWAMALPEAELAAVH